jgi:glycosyltransferase involved in cell wall biosynthesis
MRFCSIIATYNNQGTLAGVIERTLEVIEGHVIVVNDGCTDSTADILAGYADNERVRVVSYEKNRGKGYALCEGFEEARKMGYEYAVTLDSDGQHYPEDICKLTAEAEKLTAAGSRKFIVVGSRNLSADGMPKGNRFANRFGNFWFHVQTLQPLSDTQTGFRLYTLTCLPNRRCITNRYEAELELLVFSAWRGVRMCEAPVRVYYAPKGERVSHFRPFADFMRIFALNTFLFFAALLYGYPSMMIRKRD